MNKKKIKIFIAGHQGMVGSAILEKLRKNKFYRLITIEKKNLNLINQIKTFNFIKKDKTRHNHNCGCESWWNFSQQ